MNLLENYRLPGEANEILRSKSLQSIDLGDGNARIMSGHDRMGVPYRFFMHLEKNETRSKILGYADFDQIPMIEWHPDSWNKPTERVKELPEALLFITDDGEVFGQFAESYVRFRDGLEATGLPLNRWNEINEIEIATLASMRIYTVEQFAASPRDKFARMTENFQKLFEAAIQHTKGYNVREQNKEMADKVLALEAEKTRMADDMAMLKEQVSKLSSGQIIQVEKSTPRKSAVKKTVKRPKKITEVAE